MEHGKSFADVERGKSSRCDWYEIQFKEKHRNLNDVQAEVQKYVSEVQVPPGISVDELIAINMRCKLGCKIGRGASDFRREQFRAATIATIMLRHIKAMKAVIRLEMN